MWGLNFFGVIVKHVSSRNTSERMGEKGKKGEE